MDFLDMKVQKYWSFPSSYDMKKRKETFHNMLYSGKYIASEKKDGYFELIHKDKDGNTFMRARNKGVNGWIFKQDWVPHLQSFFDFLPNNTTLITEVYLEGYTSRKITTILGSKTEKAIKRQEETPLNMWVFDILSYDGKELYTLPAEDRIKYLDKLKGHGSPYVQIAEYWTTPIEIEEHLGEILERGGEGIVMTKKDYPYEPNKRKARATLKIKKELADTIDVFLTGEWKEANKLYTGKEPNNWQYWYNESKQEKILGTPRDFAKMDFLTPVNRLWYNNMAAAIQIAMYIDGKITPVGWISNITDEVRAGIVNNPDSYKGKVLEIQAMEMGNDNGIPTFRHARIVEWRQDKEAKDCLWEEDN